MHKSREFLGLRLLPEDPTQRVFRQVPTPRPYYSPCASRSCTVHVQELKKSTWTAFLNLSGTAQHLPTITSHSVYTENTLTKTKIESTSSTKGPFTHKSQVLTGPRTPSSETPYYNIAPIGHRFGGLVHASVVGPPYLCHSERKERQSLTLSIAPNRTQWKLH
jgi:hypothetical protein